MSEVTEDWVAEEQADSCSYAHEAVEQLLKENMRLKQELVDLKFELTRLLSIMEEHD